VEKEKNKETYYAALMEKRIIRSDCYLYKPLYLIEGVQLTGEDEAIFEDITGRAYEIIDKSSPLFSEEELYVSDVIKEEDLLDLYPDLCIMKAKEAYMDRICSNIYIGFYSNTEERIKLLTLDYLLLSAKAENPELEIVEPSFKGETPKKENNFKPVSKDKIIEFFDDKDNDLMAAESVEEMHKIIGEIIEKFVSISLYLDIYKDSMEILTVQDFVIDLVSEYEKLINISDVELLIDTYELIEDRFYDDKANFFEVYEKSRKGIIDVSDKVDDSKAKKEAKIMSVKEIKQYFDERIIGQEEAKKNVIQAVYLNSLSDEPGDRVSCLLVGPTGSGKTLIAETVSQCFDKPIEVIDTTQLTVPGYVGANIEDFLARILVKTNGDIKKAEEAIVVFDEIDKKGSSSNDDISGKGVLNTLLPFLQGTTYDVKYEYRTIPFNTSKLTIFATGAFTDIARSKNEKGYSSANVGFNANIDSVEDIKYDEIKIEDLVKYGNMPVELMGRFTTITQLSGHTRESLKQILLYSKGSALLAKKNLLSKLGVELSWSEEYIDAIVNRAMELKTGARSLNATVEKSIKNARWEVLLNSGVYKGIFLTEACVKDNEDCLLITSSGDKVILKDILKSKEIEQEKIKEYKIGGNL